MRITKADRRIPCILLAGACVAVMAPTASQARQATAAVDAQAACAALAGVEVPTSRIGLPTSGAAVVSAALEPARPAGAEGGARPEFCKVLASIAPVDPHSEAITVQVNLPTEWNGKAVHLGGGGLNGSLVSGEGVGPGANAQPTPLARGYATFGSDGGHRVSSPFDVNGQAAAFTNDEVLANYGGDQLKKTHDLALALLGLRYPAAPTRTYFLGGSYGGREALVVAQRFGADYDGVVSYYPVGGGVPLVASLGRLSRAFAQPGAYPNPAKQALLHHAVVEACDTADGAKDGIIADPAQCRFDVTTIRCPDGAEAGDACLSDAQITALNVMSSELRLAAPLAHGEDWNPGFNVYAGVDLTAMISGLGSAAPSAIPLAPTQPIHAKFYDVFIRGFLSRDLQADSLAIDLEKPGPLAARMNAISPYLFTAETDLSAFQGHGGKLILVHGNDDALAPVGWTRNYYDALVDDEGQASIDAFVRFYSVPGYGHGVGAFMLDWDSLSALDQWVNGGAAPEAPVARDIAPPTRGRTRPLCRYPSWPKYSGSGDLNAAASFTCATE